MALIFWDASALAKRYTEEAGYQTVDAIVARASSHEMASTPWAISKLFPLFNAASTAAFSMLPHFALH